MALLAQVDTFVENTLLNHDQLKWENNFKKNYETKTEHDFISAKMLLKYEDSGALEHLETIHEYRNDGEISILQPRFLDKSTKQKFFSYNELEYAIICGAFSGKKDVYISMNTFYRKLRRIDYIRQLRSLYVDLDIEKLKLDREQVKKALKWKITKGEIPEPTLMIESGRGYHLIWCIEDAPYQALPTWQYAEDMLIASLADLGADKAVSDSTRVLRLVKSINSKNSKECKILKNTRKLYLLRNVADVLDKKRKKIKKNFKNLNLKKNESKIRFRFTSYSLHFQRRQDIIKICELRNWDMKGYRELSLFLYRYWSCVFHKCPDEALTKTLELNSKFKQPLSKREVEVATRSAERYYEEYLNLSFTKAGAEREKNIQKKFTFGGRKFNGFRPMNKTLIDWLDIDSEEQKHLFTIISTEEKYRRKNEKRNKGRRNENGLTPKQQQLLELKSSIQELKAQGLTQKRVSEKLSKSLRTIKNYWNC